MRGHNVCFCQEIRKIFFELSSIPPFIWNSGIQYISQYTVSNFNIMNLSSQMTFCHIQVHLKIQEFDINSVSSP